MNKSIKLQVWMRDGYRCQYCGCKIYRYNGIYTNKTATVDHIKPKCYGGDDSPENLISSCIECNSLLGNFYGNKEEKREYIQHIKNSCTDTSAYKRWEKHIHRNEMHKAGMII